MCVHRWVCPPCESTLAYRDGKCWCWLSHSHTSVTFLHQHQRTGCLSFQPSPTFTPQPLAFRTHWNFTPVILAILFSADTILIVIAVYLSNLNNYFPPESIYKAQKFHSLEWKYSLQTAFHFILTGAAHIPANKHTHILYASTQTRMHKMKSDCSTCVAFRPESSSRQVELSGEFSAPQIYSMCVWDKKEDQWFSCTLMPVHTPIQS